MGPLHFIVEILFRLGIWILFLWMDLLTPVIRHIDEDEMWYYRYPSVPSIVPKRYLYLVMIVIPSMILFLQYILNRKDNYTLSDIISQVFGITLAYCINGIFTAVLKLSVGRPRPNFFLRCFPDGYGTNIDECTGEYRGMMDGRKSFPSAHSSFAFTGLMYMFFHVIRVVDLQKPRFARGIIIFLVAMLPLLAGFIGVSRIVDYHHHYTDVLAGAIIGTTIAYQIYWCYATPEIDPSEVEHMLEELKKK